MQLEPWVTPVPGILPPSLWEPSRCPHSGAVTKHTPGCSKRGVLGVQGFGASIFLFSPPFLAAVPQQHSPPCHHPGHILRGRQGCPKIVPKACQDFPERARALPSSQAVCSPLFSPELSSTSSSQRAQLCSAQPKSFCTVLALNLGVKSRIPAFCLSWGCVLPHPSSCSRRFCHTTTALSNLKHN